MGKSRRGPGSALHSTGAAGSKLPQSPASPPHRLLPESRVAFILSFFEVFFPEVAGTGSGGLGWIESSYDGQG